MQHYQLHLPVSNLVSSNRDLETQVLFGERFCCDESGKYYAYSQIVYNQSRGVWSPYPGYMSGKFASLSLSSSLIPNAVVKTFDAFLEPGHFPLPYGSLLCIDSLGKVCFPTGSPPIFNGEVFCDLQNIRFLTEPFSWHDLLKESEQFLNIPYLWGGRCVHNSLAHCGVDCSGLMHLLFQAHGWSIPRNSRDQYQDCDFIDDFESLPIGGFAFLKEDHKQHISHIMLKIGSALLIHAFYSASKVVLFEVGKDGEFVKNRFYFPKKEGKAFFGIPKKRRLIF